jgi:hypothetical protein
VSFTFGTFGRVYVRLQLVVVNLEDCYISTMKTGEPIPDITGVHPQAVNSKITMSGPKPVRDVGLKEKEAHLNKYFDRGGVFGTGEPHEGHAQIAQSFGCFHNQSLALNFNREALETLRSRKLFYQALRKPSRWNAVLKKGYVCSIWC